MPCFPRETFSTFSVNPFFFFFWSSLFPRALCRGNQQSMLGNLTERERAPAAAAVLLLVRQLRFLNAWVPHGLNTFSPGAYGPEQTEVKWKIPVMPQARFAPVQTRQSLFSLPQCCCHVPFSFIQCDCGKHMLQKQ